LAVLYLQFANSFMTPIQAKLLRLRVLYCGVIAYVPISAWVVEQMRRQAGHEANVDHRLTLWHWLLAAIAALCIFEGFHFRRRLIPPAERVLVGNGTDPKALKQWEAGHLIGFCMAVSVAMWGLVLRLIMHAVFWESLLFYGGSLLFLWLWAPRVPDQVASIVKITPS
jgi:hypothetical protein